jgi:hypothetical protein
MKHITHGLYSGFLAGLILGVLYFLDYGPGADYNRIAAWFALQHGDFSRQIGFVILVVLGAVFGLIFGLLQNKRIISVGRALLTGLLLGAAEWIIFGFILPISLGSLKSSQFTINTLLYPFVLCLVFGLLLGTIYFHIAGNQQV